MQIDLETGAMLEDGSEEELAAWVQLSRATRDHATPCEPQDETCPFEGQVQADRPTGGAQHHSGTAQTGVWLHSAHSAVRNTPPP